MYMNNRASTTTRQHRPWHIWPEHRRHIQDFPMFHEAIKTALTLHHDENCGHALYYWPFEDLALPRASWGEPTRVSDAIALCIGCILPKPGDMFARIQDNRFGILRINLSVQELLASIRALDEMANALNEAYPDHIKPGPVHLSCSFLRGDETVEDALGRVRSKLRGPLPDQSAQYSQPKLVGYRSLK